MTMVFQPIADLRHGEVVGVEALARFSSEPQQGPDRWFEDATQVGLRVELEIAAVRAAIARIDDLPSGAYLSVNLSPETILVPAFVEFVHEAPCQRLVVEVTEHAPVEDYEQLRVALADYRASGGLLAVDDAGAGFASLRHILRLAPDIIKLDVSLTGVSTRIRPRKPLRTRWLPSLAGSGPPSSLKVSKRSMSSEPSTLWG
jgi:EAL domain-containing protein (putative c-di-GMP-specific phosphodiesterase class I)